MSHNYQYISKHSNRVSLARQNLINIIRDVQNEVRDKFTFQFEIVGSYSRNMITYDQKSNIGFDLDVNIHPNDDENEYTAKQIKNTLIKAFNKYIKKYGYSNVEDSTRVITIKVKDTEHSKIIHSVDFAIVKDYVDNDGYWHQMYIKFDKKNRSYAWKEQSEEFYSLQDKIDKIKQENLWQELRDMYLRLKNENTDKHKKSRSLFAEAVNNIYNEYNLNDDDLPEYSLSGLITYNKNTATQSNTAMFSCQFFKI